MLENPGPKSIEPDAVVLWVLGLQREGPGGAVIREWGAVGSWGGSNPLLLPVTERGGRKTSLMERSGW